MRFQLRTAIAISLALVCSLALPASPAAAVCGGDCDSSGEVTIDELVTLINIPLGSLPLARCPQGDRNGDSEITIDEIVAAVNNALGGCPVDATPTPSPTETRQPTPEPTCPSFNATGNVYFGDLHVHTINSFDAHMFDVRTTPEEAYRFARGDTVLLPPLDSNGHGTRAVHLDRPLDFTAVTDHSEFLGEVENCYVPGSPSYDVETCQLFRRGSYEGVRAFGLRLSMSKPVRFPDICGTNNRICLETAAPVWQRIQDAAAQANDRCNFTSFVGYEYSLATGASTLHRNVIFRNEHVPFPISAFEQRTPLGLWRELKNACLDAGTGCDVLAITHNANESNGKMFRIEYPGATTLDDQRGQASLRAQLEPLFEIYQHKANSECLDGLSGILGAPDEQCNFERRRPAPIDDCGDGIGQTGATGNGCVSRYDYIRNVLLGGMAEKQRLGVDPFKVGFIGSTDTHNGTPGNTEESNFVGHRGLDDDTPEKQLGAGVLTDGGLIFSGGGLAGVWAPQNTREAIFSALRRRETFATSGTRLTIRVFGGWELPQNICADPNFAQVGSSLGVAMGQDLASRPISAGAPSFAVAAMRDPGTEQRPGTPLQQLQVVKGWVDGGELHYKVFDVAGNPNNGASVDMNTCTPQGSGADSFCERWTDPEFNPAVPAYYYFRVIENPSCRWSTYVCNRLPVDQRPAACADPATPRTIQERAWSSPIWYQPQG